MEGECWRLYHATGGDGRLFNYPVQLSNSKREGSFYLGGPADRLLFSVTYVLMQGRRIVSVELCMA
jgi:hypothetical protein